MRPSPRGCSAWSTSFRRAYLYLSDDRGSTFTDSMADGLFNLSDPDVAVAHRVAVVLQVDRELAVLFVVRRFVEWRCALYGEVVECQYAIVENRDVGRRFQRAVVVELRRVPDDVVRVPLSRRAHRVDHWRRLLID